MVVICNIEVGRFEAPTSSKINESTIEIDDHIDTTVLGSDCLPVHDFERSVDVSEWEASAEIVECPTFSRTIEYDYPISGKVCIFV